MRWPRAPRPRGRCAASDRQAAILLYPSPCRATVPAGGLSMKRAAIDKCEERLRRAKQALAILDRSNTEPAFRDAWEAVLVNLKSIGEILKVGARGSESCSARIADLWSTVWGDPLLRYLIEARNVEEHGLERSADYEEGFTRIGASGESIRIDTAPDGRTIVSPINGSSLTVWSVPRSFSLLPVVDKHGKRWDVPSQHVGQQPTDVSPAAVGKAGLAHFAMIVSEAKKLQPH